MNIHSREILEFNQIEQELSRHSLFEPPRPPRLSFFYQQEELDRELSLVSAFRRYEQALPMGVGEILSFDEQSIHLGVEGTVLELEQLALLARLLNAHSAVKAWQTSLAENQYIDEDAKALINEFFAFWVDTRPAAKVLGPYFDAQGRFREEEIPELRQIVRNIQRLNGNIQDSARGFLQSDKDIWSSDQATQRDGRVVLALKSDYRGKVTGLIHGFSNSGQTVYIEPQALLEQNNALNEERSRYHQEIHRILRRCSQELRPFADEFPRIQMQLERVDSLHCRACYAIAHKAVRGELSTSGVKLMQARHPALGKKAVPIDISITEPTRILVMSGPNTGGKTVSMKTLGLLSLMHQSGMEIPAAQGSMLPIFSDILVDIGDEQSIDAGLSTFSAHLKNLSKVLQGAKDDALVLLDELGSGTNPSEGSALSMAVMERLANRKVYAMVTTHHDILKAYAYQHERIDNASVQFDAQSLEPTYRIVSGIPGESHALDIARRVGMDEEIVARSRQYMSEEGLSMQQLIENLRLTQKKLNDELSLLKEQTSAVEQKADRLTTKEQELRQRELALREEKLIEHDAYLAESRKEAEKIIFQLTQERRRLRRLQRLQRKISEAVEGDQNDEMDENSQINRNTREQLDSLKQRQESERGELRHLREDLYEHRRKTSSVPTFSPGDMVRYRGSAKPAHIVEAGKKKNSWVIVAGSMRLTVAEQDLEMVSPASAAQSGKVHIEYTQETGPSNQAKAPRSGLTIDVRGQRLDEALNEVRDFVDQALVNGMTFFAVIHGKGTGVLQQGIHEFLSNHASVERIQFASPEDGGYGKSYVHLKGV